MLCLQKKLEQKELEHTAVNSYSASFLSQRQSTALTISFLALFAYLLVRNST